MEVRKEKCLRVNKCALNDPLIKVEMSVEKEILTDKNTIYQNCKTQSFEKLTPLNMY